MTNKLLLMLIGLVTLLVGCDEEVFKKLPIAKNQIEEKRLFSLKEVREDVATTIGNLNGLRGSKAKDMAAETSLLGYESKLANEVKTWSATHKFPGKSGVTIAILADDIAVLKIYAHGEAHKAKPLHTIKVPAGALWAGKSYVEDNYVLSPGKKYDFELYYKNTVHWKDARTGEEDMDGISIYLVGRPSVTAPEWLITHDPKFEEKYARKQEFIRQAELMENKAEILIDPVEGAKYSVALYYRNRKIVDAHDAGTTVKFELRTDADGKNGADTDDKGRIFVEGELLKNGASDNYRIVVKDENSSYEAWLPLIIGPLMTDLKFSPDILGKKTFDPYADEFDIKRGSGGTGYGMEIWYDLEDDVAGGIETENDETSIFAFETDKEAPQEKQGDVTGAHYLQMDDSTLKKGSHDVKWEGFNDDLKARGVVEKIDEIFMDGSEAELEEAWGHNQKHKGVSSWSVCAEGCYTMKVGVTHKSDDKQVQKCEIDLEVKYEN